MKKAIYEFLFFLIRPSFWLMNEDYCEALDVRLRKDLEVGFTSTSRFIGEVGANKYWLGNYPYAYGTDWDYPFLGRPSRMTIYKLRKKQLEFILKNKPELKLVKI